MEPTPLAAARYTRGAIAFHWLIAILIIANFIGAFIAEDLPRAQEMLVMGLHKASGMTILLLSLLRMGWRITHTPPPLPETLKAWEVALAKVTHALFYILMITVPLAGWGLHSAYSSGKPVSMFGLFDFPGLPLVKDKATVGVFHELHELSAFLMLGLLALHLAGALKHQFLDRDTTLRRMLPGG